MRPRQDLLRRYPSLAFVALAVLLATTLPSTLNLPTSGPTELAELAPVPPEDEDVPPQQGDVSALGEAGSQGLGAGAGQGAAPPPPPPPPAGTSGPGQREVVHKQCVGDPPRQTEDPLSPPCVSFFEGDNGGATAPGVTGDEIVIVAAETSSEAGTWTDMTAEPQDDDGPLDTTTRVYHRYFNHRFQTYGRTVKLWAYGLTDGVDAGPAEARADAIAIAQGPDGKRPFAVMLLDDLAGLGADEALIEALASEGLATFVHDGFDRALYQANAPHLWSYAADVQDQASLVASYLCRRLAGGPPRFAGASTRGASERVFGALISDDGVDRRFLRLKELVEVEAQERCGAGFAAEASMASSNDAATALASLRADGVTTVVPFLAGFMRPNSTRAETASVGWEPEWFIPGYVGMTDGKNAQGYDQVAWGRAFGVAVDVRRDAPNRQPYMVAYRGACPSCSPRTASQTTAYVYDVFLLTFRAIQAAGPRLTVANLEKGLRAIPPARSDDPYLAAAYFSPGNFSFIKDAMEVWWDPAGQAEGSDRPGCYRMSFPKRFRAGEWPAGDDHLFEGTPPCNSPVG